MKETTTARTRIALAVLLGVTLAIYARALGFGFVDYDDPEYVTGNAFVRAGLTPAGLAWAFQSGHAANWHPLTWLSHMLDAEIFGLDPAGHHASSVALHALNSFLVWLFFARASGRRLESLLIAALFALHPLRVESVAWISERKDVLSGCFGLAVANVWVSYARRSRGERRWTLYATALALFALGLMAKPMLVTLPVVLLAIDYGLLGRRGEGLLRLGVEKLPFFALSAASCVMTILVQRAGGSVAVASGLSMLPRLEQSLVAPVAYLGKFIWPSDLSVLYPHPYMAGGTPWTSWQLLGAGAILLLVTAAVLELAHGLAWLPAGSRTW